MDPQKQQKILLDISNKRVSNLGETLNSLCSKLGSTSPLDLFANDNKLKDLVGINLIGSRVEQLKFHNNILESLKGIEEMDFPLLQKIYLEYNRITNLKQLATCHFPILNRLSLGSNLIKSDHAEALTQIRAPMLLILSLDENQLTQADFISRMHVPLLVYLTMNQNKIRDIEFLKKCVFAQNLQKLAFQGNVIEKLPYNRISFNNLQFLDLKSNRIESLEQLTSSGFPSLKILFLQNNRISSSHFFRKLQAPNLVDLKLNQNNIGQLAKLRYHSFPKLQQLLLKKNSITGNVFDEIMISFARNELFCIFTCWRNKIIAKQPNMIYRRMKKHFPKLSFCQF